MNPAIFRNHVLIYSVMKILSFQIKTELRFCPAGLGFGCREENGNAGNWWR